MTGHVVEQVELVAVVDANVRINRPDEHRIDAAVALVEIVQIAVDGVARANRIVEVAVLDHHLRLDKTALRPLQFRAIVFGAVVADAGEALGPPLFDVGQPGREIGRVRGAGDLVALRGVAAVLGGQGERNNADQE